MRNSSSSSKKLILAESHPEIAEQWHPTKNNDLTPHCVTIGSRKIVWWKCPKNDDHEWEDSISHRASGRGCHICFGRKVVLSNCLATTHPEIAKQWHHEKNRNCGLTPKNVAAGSGKKIWWKCPKNDEHEWEDSVGHRTSGRGCHICSGRKITLSNCLAMTHPQLTEEWDATKNGDLTPYNVGAGKNKKIHWVCKKNPTHIWSAAIYSRASGVGCPFCNKKKINDSNSLATLRPELAKQWHPKKNGKLLPKDISPMSGRKIWWQCNKVEDHVWFASAHNRAKAGGTSCPICSGRKVVLSTSLVNTHPEIAKEWHPTKNGELTPDKVAPGSHGKIWWKCPKGDDHEWKASLVKRTSQKTGCPICKNRILVESNRLTTTHPQLAMEWHPDKNSIAPFEVGAGSNKKVWWICIKNKDHIWKTGITNRTKKEGSNCPFCVLGWTIDNIKLFIKSLLPNIDSLTPAELYVIFQQNGIVNLHSKSGALIKAVRTGRFPKEELEKFVNGQPSLVDDFITGDAKNDQLESFDERLETLSELNSLVETEELPVIETQDILAALENSLIANVDGEAAEFFIHSAVAKIWRHAFIDDIQALEQLDAYVDGRYIQEVKNQFLSQYYGAKNLLIPDGYCFVVDNKPQPPNLMQRYTAYLVDSKRRVGNWSGTGAGKTLSAVLSSRVVDAKLTIICCPNSVVSRWDKGIKEIYSDSIVFTKDLDFEVMEHAHHYLVLNYEFFQQPGAEGRLKKFLANNKIDFVVIDEIHHSKQRVVENISKRKKVVSAMLSEAFNKNENLHVLGMSATPVINNLFEGKTLIELITGVSHNDLNTASTISNCISLYQKLVLNGIRWVPQYSQKLSIQPIEIDCSDWIDDIKKLGMKSTMVELEGVLTLAKIPTILDNIKPKTIVYTHFLKNIILPLKNAIECNGWRAAIYSGDDKTGLENFINGNADVLIATSCISTGVDGLQSVCNRIIVNALPWTHAEFEQLKGRVYRQGQIQDHVDVIVPLTYANINGERWSWCDSRWKRIQFKKSISDAAVDGIIPEGQLRTPAQAYQDAMNWLKRLESGQVNEIQREIISLSLSEEMKKSGLRKFGDFSQMNRLMNMTSSSVMHEKLERDPSWWECYHALYREARQEWSVVPFEEAIKWCKLRPHFVVGDFGCGEALLAQSIENIVYSFDHIAINDQVIACDMSHVPLEDNVLDAAIFSLSLMGANYIDYIREAHRCLKLDGQLWVAETTSRFESLDILKNQICDLGFSVRSVLQKSNFTFLNAIKKDD